MDIEITGYVEIRNGKTVIRATNHFVDAFTKTVGGFLCAHSFGSAHRNLPLWDNLSIYLGSDTSTATTHDMTSLVSPIGTPPGTEPSSKTGALTNPSAGVWRVVYTATWGEGTISGTVGEAALYLRTVDVFTWGNHYFACEAGKNMVSRLSAKDGDFSAFVIDTSKPLVVNWTIELKGV